MTFQEVIHPISATKGEYKKDAGASTRRRFLGCHYNECYKVYNPGIFRHILGKRSFHSYSINYSPRSPDIMIPNFFRSGNPKEKFYINKPRFLLQLKEKKDIKSQATEILTAVMWNDLAISHSRQTENGYHLKDRIFFQLE